MPNFENRLREPKVLPSRSQPACKRIGRNCGRHGDKHPHNLGEVIDATVYRRKSGLHCRRPARLYKRPDFPTYATIFGMSGIRQAYATGKGRVIVRARAQVEEEHNRIIVTEIPYQVNKACSASRCESCQGKKIEELPSQATNPAETECVLSSNTATQTDR